MGLGKTMQCAAFLAGLFASGLIRRGAPPGRRRPDACARLCRANGSAPGGARMQGACSCDASRQYQLARSARGSCGLPMCSAALTSAGVHRRALVVAPKTLLAHWAAELAACGLGRFVSEYYGSSARERCAPPTLRASLQMSLACAVPVGVSRATAPSLEACRGGGGCGTAVCGSSQSTCVRPHAALAKQRPPADACRRAAPVGWPQLAARRLTVPARAREGALDSVLRGRGVLLSTYGMVLHNAGSLAGGAPGSAAGCAGDAPVWDVLILDEARPQGHAAGGVHGGWSYSAAGRPFSALSCGALHAAWQTRP